MISSILLLIIYVAFISLGLPDSVIGAAWPSMYVGLGVPISWAGVISMIVAAGTIVSSVLSDRLIRRFGVGRITLVSVLMTALALLGFALSHHFALLCVLAIPLGLGAGSVDAALNNYVANHYAAKHMSWLHCFWGVGATIGPMVMAWGLSRYDSWHLGYWVIGLLQLALVVVLLVSLPLWQKAAVHHTASGGLAGASHGAGGALSIRQIVRLNGVKPVLAAFFCYCSIEASLGLWGGSYLVLVKQISPEAAARWVAVYYFGITFGRFLSGFLMMYWSTRRMIRLGQGLIALGVALMLVSGLPLFYLGFFLVGLGCAPIFPSLLYETPSNFGKQHSQSVMGVQMASAYVGTTFAPPLFGWLATQLGYAWLPVFLAVILLWMVTMVEYLRRKVVH